MEVMVNDHRFPTLQETAGFLASAAVERKGRDDSLARTS
jgi:hypothetical protein